MQINNTISPKFGMAFRTEVLRPSYLIGADCTKLTQQIRKRGKEIEKYSQGVSSVVSFNLDKKGGIKSVDVDTSAIAGTSTLKGIFLELFDMLKGKNAQFSKKIPRKEVTIDRIIAAVRATSSAYRKTQREDIYSKYINRK